MGFLDKLFGRGKKSDEVRTESVSFTISPGTEMRKVDDGGVEAIDSALARVGTGELLHLMDPKRILGFSAGGPSVWSVALVPVGDDVLYVTYGNSDRVDASREGVGFELSILVPARCSGFWAGMLLRQLVRYMLMSKRELKVGDFMPFPSSLTQVTPGTDPQQFPPTEMNAVFLVPDPLLPRIDAPRGAIEVRRVVGIYADERVSMEPWSVLGFAGAMKQSVPRLETDLTRARLTGNAAFLRAMEEGSRREGSQFGFIAVNGVRWTADDEKCQVVLPGGAEALRIHRMVEARLRHGRNLLIHDMNPDQQLAVALQPVTNPEDTGLAIEGSVVVLRLTPDDPLLQSLANAGEQLVWTFN
ncbi:MAG TPA: suppressor of fused domain protein [Archangium sp.]